MNRGSQGGVDRVAQGDLHRFVVLVQGVVCYGHGDGFSRVTRCEGQGAAGQGVIGARARGRPARNGVVHGHRLTRRRVQRYCQLRRGAVFVSIGDSRVEGHLRCRVVILDCAGVSGDTSQGDIGRVAQGDLHRLLRLVQGIVVHGYRDGFRRISRCVGQGAAGQGVVGAGTGG